MKSRAKSGSVKQWLGASALSFSALALLPLSVALAAEAGAPQQRSPFNFALAAKPLPQALSDFSRITGISVVYTDEAPYGITAPAVSGQMSAEQAIQRLLSGSGLSFRRTDAHTMALEPQPSDGALNLGATTITSVMGMSYQPPPTSSVMRSSALLQDIPQTINVIPAQAIRDQAPRNLDDALANVSGITQGNTLGSTQDSVMTRGFGDNRNGSIMRDGMPIVQGRGLNATVDRIEVLKGPASLLYGIQDPGGVVNLVSKKPELEQYNALTLRGSTYGDGKNGSGGGLDSTGALGDSGLAYRMVLDHEDEDYWRNFGTHRETLVAPSLAWYGERTTLLFAYEHREFLTPFDRGTLIDPRDNHPLDISRERRLDEPFNNMEGRSDLYHFEADHELNDNWKAHFGYSWNRETYDASQVRVTAINTSNGTLTRSMDGTQNAISTDRFATASLEGKVNVLGMQHDLVFGVDDEYRKIYREDLIRQKSLTTFSYLNPVYGREVVGSTVSPADSAQTDLLRSDSLFLQDSVHLTDQWILVAGGRFQAYDQYAGKGVPFQANTDSNGQKWVPRAGLVYKYTDALSFYGSYTESFKPNSTIAPLSGSSTVLDGSIAPEEAKSWEVGAKLDIPGRLTGNVALFDIKKRNVLVANAEGPVTLYSAAGEVRSRGLEVDLTGQLSDRWSMIGSYAYTDAEVTEDPTYKGKKLQNVAKNSGSLSAVYDFGTIVGGDQFRVGAGARYVGERAGNAVNDFDLPSYTVADAFATYDTKVEGQKVKFQLNVKNLFDRTYYTSAASRFFVSMGDSRQVSLSSTLEF
ncbi:TonB-dependent siderophore receptor [Pseudomonas sp. GB2N2]